VQVNVSVDTSGLDRLASRYTKNLAYSTAQAINDVARTSQERIRAGLRRTMHVRKAAFIDRSVKIFVFANVQAVRPYAELGIDNKTRLLLSLFEKGAMRTAFVGRDVAVPITGRPARLSPTASVRADLTFQQLAFHKGRVTEAGRAVLKERRRAGDRSRKLTGGYYFWQGAQRTFILTGTARLPYGGVFQRIGPKRGDIVLLYAFKPSVRIAAALNFVNTTQATFNGEFQYAFQRRFYRL
jgi:hypothetical protein